VKLTDFGIATSTSEKQITKTGSVVGSLHYMSPEQVKGGSGDARSDIYSTGVMLYELAVGKLPFDADSDYGIMAAHIHQAPAPPVEVKPGLPPPLSRAIMKALEKDPANRFQTANEFRAALEARDETARDETKTVAMFEAPQMARAAVNAAGSWDPAFLEQVRKEFATYIGPMARILVSSMAKRAQNVDELYQLLAAEIPTSADRAKFLGSRHR